MTSSPYQVTLTDDNDDHCMLIEDILLSTGFAQQVIRFSDAESTLTHFLNIDAKVNASNTQLPDFLFLDLALPGMSGIELLKQLKSNLVTRSVPVIILTVSDSASHVQAAFENGASGFLVKPLQHEDLRRKIIGLKSYWDTVSESPDPDHCDSYEPVRS